MHIPDAAISPATSLAAGTVMAPVWYVASRRLRSTLGSRRVPLLAVGAAFSFALMMFNLPAPGGTTVHPVGAGLLAVVLGPSAAVIGMTAALAIQALFFGDGGIFALGANCFTMGFAMPVCAWLVYRLAAGRAPADSPQRAAAAGLGAYVGLNAAALLTAVVIGVQPALYHDAAGRALYFPFGLAVTVPAMLGAHLLIAGPAEAIVTAMAVRHLQRIGVSLCGVAGRQERHPVRLGRSLALPRSAGASPSVGRLEPRARDNGRAGLLWAALAAAAALSPLGLLARGDAWGEWGAEDLARRAGYVPTRFAAVEARGWKGFNLLPDYLSAHGMAAYALAAFVGVLLVAAVLLAAGRALTSSGRRLDTAVPAPVAPSVRPGELPAWLTAPAPVECEMRDEHRRTADSGLRVRVRAGAESAMRNTRHAFLDRTLAGIASSVRDTVFAEKWARSRGLLQRIEPRAKTAGLLALAALGAFLNRAAPVAALAALAVCLATASRVPLGAYVRRAWLGVPLFVGAVALPAALNLATPGPELLVLRAASPHLAITAPGAHVAGMLVLRVGTALSFATLLTLTTPWNDLLYGLRALFVPRTFLVVLTMTYRYLGVFAQTAVDSFTARESRGVGRATPAADHGFLGGAVGSMFAKTLTLTDEVHAAMLSRGWNGEARSLARSRLVAADLLWLGAVALIVAAGIGGARLG